MTTRLDEIRARLDAATPGPWRRLGNTVFIDPPLSRENRWWAFPGDWETAELIANAPSDLAWALDEVERLRAGILAHRDAVRTGLLGKAEQDASDAHLWSLVEVAG